MSEPDYTPTACWAARERRTTRSGYVEIHIPEHPKSYNGWVLEHRLVIESEIGRVLDCLETVHHIGPKHDNRRELLIACTREQHVLAHG